MNTGSAVLAADKMTVTLTLNEKAALTKNPTTVTVVVSKNVKDSSGKLLGTDITKTAEFSDVAVPTLVSVEQVGSKKIEVKFSEPVYSPADASDAGIDHKAFFSINDGAVAIASAVRKASDNTVYVITTAGDLPLGNHTLLVNKAGVAQPLEDYVGYKLLPVSQTFTVVANTSAPTVTVTKAEGKVVTLKFDKAVTIPSSSNIEFRVGYNSAAANVNKVNTTGGSVVQVANDEYKVTFPTLLSAGNNDIYIHYISDSSLDSTNSIFDNYGNKLAQDTKVVANVTQDTTAPTVTEVAYVNATSVDVTFSEDVTGATTATNYTLKDSKGKSMSIVSVVQIGTSNTYRMTTESLAAGGNFKLAISTNIKDTSVAQNKLTAYETTIAVADKVAPTISDVSSNGTTTFTKLYVTFSEPMKTSGSGSILDLENYRLENNSLTNITKLEAGTTITQNGNVAIITFPSTVTKSVFDELIIGQVQDLAGNSTSAIQNIMTINDSATIPTGLYEDNSAKMTNKKTLEFTYNRKIKSIDAAQIKETTSTSAVGASASFAVNADGTSNVTVTLDRNINTTDTSGLVFQLDAGAITDVNDLKNANETTAIVSGQVKDYVKPEISTIATNDNNMNGLIDEIKVTYSEAIYAGSVQDSDYTVEGYTITGVSVASSIVTIKVKEQATPDGAVTPKVTQVGAVTDASPQRNELASSAAKVAADAVGPVVMSAKVSENPIADNATMTIKFNEAVTLPNVTDTAAITKAELDTILDINSANTFDETARTFNAVTDVTGALSADRKTLVITFTNATSNTIVVGDFIKVLTAADITDGTNQAPAISGAGAIDIK